MNRCVLSLACLLVIIILSSIVYASDPAILEVTSQVPSNIRILSLKGQVVTQCSHAEVCYALVSPGTYIVYAEWNGLCDTVTVHVTDITVVKLDTFFFLKKLFQLIGIGLVLFGVAYAANEYCKVRRYLSSIMVELPVEYQKPMRILKVKLKFEEIRRGGKIDVEDIIMRRARVRAQARKISDKVLEEITIRTSQQQHDASLSIRKFVVPEGEVIEVLPRMIVSKEEEEASVMAGLERVHAPKSEQRTGEKEYLSDTLR